MPRSSPPSRPTFDPQELLTSTAVAAFASDQSGFITVWNQAAEALLGHQATRVVGKRCFKVICGRDLFGNRFCNESCAVRKMRRHREPIHPYQFQVKHHSGGDAQSQVFRDYRPGCERAPLQFRPLAGAPRSGC